MSNRKILLMYSVCLVLELSAFAIALIGGHYLLAAVWLVFSALFIMAIVGVGDD